MPPECCRAPFALLRAFVYRGRLTEFEFWNEKDWFKRFGCQRLRTRLVHRVGGTSEAPPKHDKLNSEITESTFDAIFL